MLGRVIAAAALAIALQASPSAASDLFNRHTMMGWQRTAGAGLLFYGETPLHATRKTGGGRVGLALTSPYATAGGRVGVRATAPRAVDIRFGAMTPGADWNWSLRSNQAVAWSTEPKEVPAARDYMFGGSGSWLAVGALTAGAIIGIFLITEDDVPPRTTTP